MHAAAGGRRRRRRRRRRMMIVACTQWGLTPHWLGRRVHPLHVLHPSRCPASALPAGEILGEGFRGPSQRSESGERLGLWMCETIRHVRDAALACEGRLCAGPRRRARRTGGALPAGHFTERTQDFYAAERCKVLRPLCKVPCV
jgi:hypothetical protein